MNELNRLKIAIFMAFVISGLFFLLAMWKIEQQKEEISKLKGHIVDLSEMTLQNAKNTNSLIEILLQKGGKK